MIDIRKMDIWYSEDIDNFDRYNQKKVENIFTKNQERINRIKILNFIKKEIRKIFPKLNKIHKANFSEAFWQKVLFPWFFYVADSIFINYQIFEKIFKKDKKFITYQINTKDMLSRQAIKIDLEAYHIMLASEYIKFKKYDFTSKKFKINPLVKNRKNFIKNKVKSTFLKSFLSFISKKIYNLFPPKFFIIDLGLPFKDVIFLNLKLKQFPFYWIFSKYKENEFNNNLRREIFKNNEKNQFNKYFNLIIAKIFPKIFLEDFSEVMAIYKKDFKLKPKYLLTQNLYEPEEKIIYLALMQMKKTKLFLFQHGGLYGTHLFATGELTEMRIADKFFSWGWKKNKKTHPFYSLPFSYTSKNLKTDNHNNKILLCLILNPRFLNVSGDIQRNNIERLKQNESIKKFTEAIKFKYAKNITIRYLKRAESSSSHLDKKNFPRVKKFDGAHESLFKVINNYKLSIHFSINTSGLETLSFGKPTLFLIDKKSELFQKSFYPILDKMIKNEIVHLNYRSLANFLNKNFENIEDWWNSKKIKKIRSQVLNRYARTTDQYDKKILNSLSKFS